MTILHLDFETRSAADLKAVGLDVYSKHPTTEAICMAWTSDDQKIRVWNQFDFNFVRPPAGSWLRDLGESKVYAHNAAFEFAIWNNVMVPRYGWPPLKLEQMVCTMAMSYAMALPGSLDGAAGALGLEQRKDPAGHRLMLQMSKPKALDALGDPIWHEEPEKLERLYAYCRQDVEVERALHTRLLELSPAETQVWRLDQAINQRGVYVDRPAVIAAISIVEQEKLRLDAAMRATTSNAVATCNATGQLGDWIRLQGVAIDGVAKADVIDALALEDLPDRVRTALLLRQEAAKSSTAKLKAMAEAVSTDGRLRGMFNYHGATTGRWSGRRVQLQNLPRYRPGIKAKHVDHMIELMAAGKRDELDMLYGPVLPAMSDCLRGFLCAAPGNHLIAGDFANIEGRVLAWLAGEEWKLDAFREYDAGTGLDLYILTYAKSFGLDPTTIPKSDPRRQVGKVEELAFGFGGGVGAWRTMKKAYPDVPEMTDDAINAIKNGWRKAHSKIADYDHGYWVQLDWAAIEATLHPGKAFSAGAAGREVKFKVAGSFLWCRLPSGRVLCYPYPQVRDLETPWGSTKQTLTFKAELVGEAIKKAKIVPDPSNGGPWWRISTYGGSLAENVTQAVARDILADAMLRLSQHGYAITMHAHDEAVGEVPADAPLDEQQTFEQLMAVAPSWAAGLPIAVEGWRATRYRK